MEKYPNLEEKSIMNYKASNKKSETQKDSKQPDKSTSICKETYMSNVIQLIRMNGFTCIQSEKFV